MSLLVDLGVCRGALLSTTGSTVLGLTHARFLLLLSEFTCCVHKMVLLVFPIIGLAAGPVTAAPTEGKQAHFIIMISANCGDGSVTVSSDMLHIVSITPNCCSRPWHRKILKILLILWALVKLKMNGD